MLGVELNFYPSHFCECPNHSLNELTKILIVFFLDADKVWINPVANPPPAKKKIPVRVHTKIRESEVSVIGLGNYYYI